MILRGETIFRDESLIGKRVFVSAHALNHLGQNNYRGVLVKAQDGYIHLDGQSPIRVDLTRYDVMMSPDSSC